MERAEEEKRPTRENVLAKIDAARSLAYAPPGDVEDPIEHVWMAVMKPNPGRVNNCNTFVKQF